MLSELGNDGSIVNTGSVIPGPAPWVSRAAVGQVDGELSDGLIDIRAGHRPAQA
jgi:hypothetical protein